MLHLFAQSVELTTTSFDTSSVESSASFGAVLALALPLIVLAIVLIAAQWRVFKKAGKPGWASIVPVYNTWVLFEITGYPAWIALLLFVPVVNLVSVVFGLMASYKLAKLFGKSDGFAICNIFFPLVTYPIMGFGKATFNGSAAAVPTTPFAAGPSAPTPPTDQTPTAFPPSPMSAPEQTPAPISPAPESAPVPQTPETPNSVSYSPAPQPQQEAAPANPAPENESQQQPPLSPPSTPIA